MCRGCFLLTKEGKTTTEEYCELLDEYYILIRNFKDLNLRIHNYKETLDKKSRIIVDPFHKELVRIKRGLGSAEEKMKAELVWNADSMKYEIVK